MKTKKLLVGAIILIVALACISCSAPNQIDGGIPQSSSPFDMSIPWTPSSTMQLTSMSEDEAMAIRAMSLQNYADSTGIENPPTIALIRWTSQMDYGPTIAECLVDAGYYAVGAGASIHYPDGIGVAQQSALHLAFYRCYAQYSLNPKYSQTLTPDQWGLWFDYDVEWLVPCLSSLGMTELDPPSRDSFIAQSLQVGYPIWMPWSDADKKYSDTWQDTVKLTNTCPQYPPDKYMWG